MTRKQILARIQVLTTEIATLTAQLQHRRTADHCSSVVRESIRAFAKANPRLTQKKIGLIFNVHQGRVSEALNDLR